MVKVNKIDPRLPATLATNRSAAACVPDWRYSESTGTNAWEKAPSAKSLRKKFGILNATKNASASALAPRTLARTISLNSPKTRDSIVIAPTTALDLKRLRPVDAFFEDKLVAFALGPSWLAVSSVVGSN